MRARQIPNQTEAEFQEQVLTIAQIYQWRPYHTRNSRGSHPGFPDLVLVRAPELIFAELKTESGILSPDQEAWVQELAQIGAAIRSLVDVGNAIWEGDNAPIIDTFIWRPSNWPHIEQRLKPRPRIAA